MLIPFTPGTGRIYSGATMDNPGIRRCCRTTRYGREFFGGIYTNAETESSQTNRVSD
ncbi:MAG: hypothetical protein MK110_02690 [Fuerstiella sp.]|nr:hypothetical protein [Fuerstiella sp.]